MSLVAKIDIHWPPNSTMLWDNSGFHEFVVMVYDPHMEEFRDWVRLMCKTGMIESEIRYDTRDMTIVAVRICDDQEAMAFILAYK